jgi:RNA polymerase sigma-70 factor (ECF subfamily)
VALRGRAQCDRRPRAQPQRNTGRHPDEPAREAGPADHAEQGWVAWRVHRALEELPEREREVISLAYWSGLSQSEVAEFLDIPLGTVKTRTRSALAHLADLLGEELA